MGEKSEDLSLIQSFYRNHHVVGRRLQQSFLERERGELFLAWIGLDKRILDLGGRDGTLTRHFAQGHRVTVADIDAEALDHARTQYDFETKVVDLNRALPFSDESFDVVVMAEVLEHLPYPRLTLAEARRILTPRGSLVGNVPLAYHLKDRYQVLRGKKLVTAGDPTHLQFFTYDDLLSLLRGFFEINDLKILKGGWKAEKFPRFFARNVAFMCSRGGV